MNIRKNNKLKKFAFIFVVLDLSCGVVFGPMLLKPMTVHLPAKCLIVNCKLPVRCYIATCTVSISVKK